MAASSPKCIFILFLVFILNGFPQLSAQPDTSASGPSDSGIINSDSSIYNHFHYKPRFIADLPEPLKETSGLLFFNGQLWTINDSGNQPQIYQLDTTNGSVVRTVVIRNSVNTDWESITQDEANVYIGDFGNNAGNRKNLCILKILKSDIICHSNDTVNAAYIYFSYPDQTYFETALNNNNFDCEAFFYHNDSLHLLSKNWLDLQTKHYILPVEPGNYKARLAESFNADGLITDASINSQGNIVLLGYKNKRGKSYTCFVWLLSGYEGRYYFSGIKRRVELGSALHLGQTEGIVLRDDNTGWLSSESIQSRWIHRPAKLFMFNFSGYLGVRSWEQGMTWQPETSDQ
jgi:hypothetical protein